MLGRQLRRLGERADHRQFRGDGCRYGRRLDSRKNRADQLEGLTDG